MPENSENLIVVHLFEQRIKKYNALVVSKAYEGDT